MKFTCSKNNLSQAVSIALKAVSPKTPSPILECIMIEAMGNDIKLTSNDTELGIETFIDGTVLTPGKIAVDAKFFSDIIRKLPESDVDIETDENNTIHIGCEKAKYDIPGKSGDDFVFLPQIEPSNVIELSQYTLRETIRQTIFSTSDNESNKLMSGELFEITGNHLKVVSLDGHRISIRSVELKDSYNSIKVVVPGKTLNEISKIISGGIEDMMRVGFANNHISFEFDRTKVISRLLDGEYYKVSQMISNDYSTKVTINRKDLYDCIDRATLLIRESDKKPVVINISNSSFELKINSSFGKMDEDIDISKEGNDLLIGFNPKFLLDALRAIDDETIHIYLMGPTSPCVIKDDLGSFIYLILPVNINAANR